MNPVARRPPPIHRRALPMAVVVVVALAACADADRTGGPDVEVVQPRLEGPHVVRFPLARPVIERIAFKGQRHDTGCGFPRSFDTPGSQQESIFESVAEVDTVTCDFVVARHPPASAPDFVGEALREHEARLDSVRARRQ
jgi:hypothetical protein